MPRSTATPCSHSWRRVLYSELANECFTPELQSTTWAARVSKGKYS
ncbi:hypothetical protein MUN84_15430 [Hymenobacter sp. 5516J-16]|nr:hypothetical protein [Hymenobacter sp. 5516J-16]UOQ76002.1 hypothetical protein MUN84_15430 [Hymenobacter sp. 5516J-16]